MPAFQHKSWAAWWASPGVFVLALLAALYGNYPFDGMVVNESWNLHVNEVDDFRFPGYGDSTKNDAPKTFLYDPATGQYDFSFIHSRRGLVPIIYLLFDKLSVGNHVVFMNAVCVAVIAANLLLFAYVVRRLAGPDLVLPALVVYSLYPFAAASHFLQVIVVNNLAVTFVLLSLSLYLKALSVSREGWMRVLPWGLIGLLCYWISIFNHEYALFLSPLFLYLALYEQHDRVTLWRFTHWRRPGVLLGAAYLGVTATAAAFLVADVPSLLLYAPRFRELAATLHAPDWLVPGLTAGANAALFYASAVFSNTIGYLLYPATLLWRDVSAAPSILLQALIGGALAGCLVIVLSRGAGPESGEPQVAGNSDDRFLPLFGAAWAILAYLPFATSIGYPRVVGMMADRVNILASCGVAVVYGWVLQRLLHTVRGQWGLGRKAILCALWLLLMMLFLNLSIQRDYYVDAYHKEQRIARAVLDAGQETERAGRHLIVLLDRSTKTSFPRAQLLAALNEPEFSGKARRLGEFLLDRYFREEVISTSFHLNGLYLFGCCPDSGYQTFDGYAKLLSKDRVPVFKFEEPFRLYDDGESWQIGYREIRVYARTFGMDKLMAYSKADYQLMVLELDESFFRFGGATAYRLYPFGGAVAHLNGNQQAL